MIVFAIAAMLARMAPALPGADEVDTSSPPTRVMGFVETCVAPMFAGGRTLAARTNELFNNQRGWILLLILLSGANAFFYEVLWTRMLSHVLGGSIYAFATMLAAFLTGIALGGGLAGPFAKDSERAALSFATAQVAIAVLSIGIYTWMGFLIPETRSTGSLAGMAVGVLLPATIFIGATFPLAVRVLANTGRDAGVATAKIYSWNTVGAIVGAILAGFYIIPALGFEGSIKLAVLVNLALALWTIAFVSKPRHAYAGALAAMLLLLIVIYRPSRPQAVIDSTAFSMSSEFDVEELYFSVGRSSTVYLAESGGTFELRTNGLPEASILVRGAPPILHSQSWLTALPVAARPDAESVLIIGFGGGVAVEGVPASVDEIDVIELEPEVLNANRQLSGRRINDPLEDPRVTVIINDARNALRLTSKSYDVIVSQPSHPWTAGASHLFTREFVAIARDHLNPGGVFLQWMNSEFLDEPLLRSLAATVVDVFDYVRVYETSGSVLMFLASDDPLNIERQLIRTGRPLNEHLLHYSYMGLNGADDFVAALALDEDGVEAFASGAPLSTDDRNYMATHSRFRGDGLNPAQLATLFEPYDPLLDSDSWIHTEMRAQLNFVYIATRLLANAQYERASGLADAVADVSTRALIAAVGYEFTGQADRAEEALRVALAANPNNIEAQFQLISKELSDFARGQPSEEARSVAARLTGAAAAVVEGWPVGAAQDWQGLADLDDALARTDVTDIWYPETIQLRADWRTKVLGDERFPFDALRMVDRALVISPELDLYVLRAAAASALDDDGAFVESGRYVEAYITNKLQRMEEGTYIMSDAELETTLLRLGAFNTQLEELSAAGDRRAREVREAMLELFEEVEALARERLSVG